MRIWCIWHCPLFCCTTGPRLSLLHFHCSVHLRVGCSSGCHDVTARQHPLPPPPSPKKKKATQTASNKKHCHKQKAKQGRKHSRLVANPHSTHTAHCAPPLYRATFLCVQLRWVVRRWVREVMRRWERGEEGGGGGGLPPYMGAPFRHRR